MISRFTPALKTLKMPICLVGIAGFIFVVTNADATLIHRWSFSEASGTNVFDSIGTANGKVVINGTNADYTRVSGMVRLAGGTRSQTDYVHYWLLP